LYVFGVLSNYAKKGRSEDRPGEDKCGAKAFWLRNVAIKRLGRKNKKYAEARACIGSGFRVIAEIIADYLIAR
jgi:hypothetical protein